MTGVDADPAVEHAARDERGASGGGVQTAVRPIGLAPGAPREAAGQDAAKYGSTNPVVRRLLDRWSGRLREVVGPVQGTIVDVGVGEGLCLERVLASPQVDARVVGVEYRLDKARVAAGLPEVSPVVGDAGMLPLPDGCADLVTCIEVLEHLPEVAPAVAELARVAADRCVVSVPWEPWFRLGNLGRGKNVAPPRQRSRARAVVHAVPASAGARGVVRRGAGRAGLPVDHRGGAPSEPAGAGVAHTAPRGTPGACPRGSGPHGPSRYPWADMSSVWTQLEPHLAGVEKPARYIGLELGAQRPVPGHGAVSWLLTYPDTYEIGLPNQGLQILYEILNERDDAGRGARVRPVGRPRVGPAGRAHPAVLGRHAPARRTSSTSSPSTCRPS